MKIDLNELKKAVIWVESNSKDNRVEVHAFERDRLTIKCMDRNDQEVEITLFGDQTMLPKIKKTDVLR